MTEWERTDDKPEDEGPRESEPNPTQERMDGLGESESDVPVDVTDDTG